MPDEPKALSEQDVHARLHAIAELLRHAQRLDAAAQTALADLVDELDNALTTGTIAHDEATRLATAASHFAEAIQRRDEAGMLTAARGRLAEAALKAESQAPLLAGLARRFMDALANIGI